MQPCNPTKGACSGGLAAHCLLPTAAGTRWQCWQQRYRKLWWAHLAACLEAVRDMNVLAHHLRTADHWKKFLHAIRTWHAEQQARFQMVPFTSLLHTIAQNARSTTQAFRPEEQALVAVTRRAILPAAIVAVAVTLEWHWPHVEGQTQGLDPEHSVLRGRKQEVTVCLPQPQRHLFHFMLPPHMIAWT